MGPLLLTGLATGGAAIAIGIIAASTTRSTRSVLPAPPSRRLALILTAFVEGSGVWGVVIGLLAVTTGEIDAPGATPIVAPVLAIAGAAVAFVVMVRNLADLDPRYALTAIMFIVGLAVLALVVAIMGIVIHERGARVPESWPFAILGVVMAGSVIGLGATGARSVRAIAGLDDAAAVAVSSKAIARCLPFQVAAVGAAVVAIVLIVRS
jgi:F0F1-type ATP synthase membrane subunit c/vacuolar-type H+-ATPase subunit K